MKTFQEWMDARSEKSDPIAAQFGGDMEKARTILADLFRSVRSLEDHQDQVGEHLSFVAEKLSEIYELLKKYDFKPVLPNGVEFRIVNTSVGNLVHPNSIKHLADDFRRKKLSGKILAAEDELGKMHSSVSPSQFNRSFIRNKKGVPQW